VVWKSPAELPPEVAAAPRLRPFVYRFSSEAALPEWMSTPPEPGDPFVLKTPLNTLLTDAGVEQPVHPYLVPGWWAGTLPSGTLAVYVGPVRTPDRGSNVVHLRHTFLVGATVYIVPDLNTLQPL